MYYLVKDLNDNYYKIVSDDGIGSSLWEYSEKEAFSSFSPGKYTTAFDIRTLKQECQKVEILLTFDQNTNPEFFI